jgi:hypothetical protein
MVGPIPSYFPPFFCFLLGAFSLTLFPFIDNCLLEHLTTAQMHEKASTTVNL